MRSTTRSKKMYIKLIDLALFTVVSISGAAILIGVAEEFRALVLVAICVCAASFAFLVRLRFDPDSVRARQSESILKISRETFVCFQEGLTPEAAQQVCKLLLPATGAQAVAITDREHILGYVGLEASFNQSGSPIRTKATHSTLEDGIVRVLGTPEAIGFPSNVKHLRAGIIVPLRRGDAIIGTLKFYYRHSHEITETQLATAEGLGELMSTQIAANALEQQTKLATTMELKALQSQINPHFLFNTINTIASLVRTDPDRARMLLREFAIFYRRTLENSAEMVELMREIEQTMRYFTFEVARFGEDRVMLDVEIEPGLEDLLVPAFMIQPLVENAVRHAMPQEGKLTIHISAYSNNDNVEIEVRDNGIGMDAAQSKELLTPSASKGLGIAMKNISERLTGFYGTESRMEIESEVGKGTCVRMIMKDALKTRLD